MIKICLLAFLISTSASAVDIYSNLTSVIPLSFSRVRAGVLVSGLSITVTVKNLSTNAVLLASTSVPEIVAGVGIYTYNWTHGLGADAECLVTYAVGSSIYTEQILVQGDSVGGRAN